ncbi:MAG: shikimate kinase [Lachnospiraceae bacterium]|nr:shikimate kinase [Lachnospiraceae bacterium]
MEKLDSNIVLIGFMGCGKTTVSKGLKRKYGMDIVEMDGIIEEREGKSISDIFKDNGEEYFRNLETDLLKEMQSRKNTIISCGGGTPLREVNVAEMKKNGKVFLLTAKPETILNRVKNSHNRPLLEGNKNVEFIENLLEQRRDKYEACADVVIATDGRSVDDICEEIMDAAKAF